ncbi:hypothetical protein [Leucobacter chromiisoli]|nr:hypothetical protein [Leucobacter chromiisoli]
MLPRTRRQRRTRGNGRLVADDPYARYLEWLQRGERTLHVPEP